MKRFRLALVAASALAALTAHTFANAQKMVQKLGKGEGQVDIDENTYDVVDGSAVIVPAGARHNVRNTGDAPLKLYTIYGPPEHKDKIVQRTKEEAEARHAHEEWDGATTE